MFTRPSRKLAAMVNITIAFSPRNMRRIATHLTQEEMNYVCPDQETLMLGRFLDTVLPRIQCFSFALMIGAVISLMAISGWIADAPFFPIGKTPMSFILSMLFVVQAFAIKLAIAEHQTNTRHAKALATLYTAKRFKPYRHYLLPLTPLLHGYFDPSIGLNT